MNKLILCLVVALVFVTASGKKKDKNAKSVVYSSDIYGSSTGSTTHFNNFEYNLRRFYETGHTIFLKTITYWYNPVAKTVWGIQMDYDVTLPGKLTFTVTTKNFGSDTCTGCSTSTINLGTGQYIAEVYGSASSQISKLGFKMGTVGSTTIVDKGFLGEALGTAFSIAPASKKLLCFYGGSSGNIDHLAAVFLPLP